MRVMILAVMLWASAAHAKAKKPSNRSDIVARVIEAPAGPIICGVIANRGPVKFEVVEVKNGTLAQREIVAELVCPEGWDVGQVYAMTVEPTKDPKRHRIVRERLLRDRMRPQSR